MLGPSFALALILGVPGSPDPSSLVGQLGSDRYALRESAEATLTGLGRVALPALRVGLESRDPEVRSRSSAIIGRIEDTLMVQPTPIRLDFRDIPLVEAIRAINAGSGLQIQLAPGESPAWSGRRLTLRSAEALPFWAGVNLLCRSAGLHYVLGSQPPLGMGDTAFPLYDGFVPPPDPVSDSGPFRVQLASVHYQSEILLGQPRPAAPSADASPGSAPGPAIRQFYVQLVVAAEPRLSITQNGAVKLVAAVDDQGHSLRIPAGLDAVQRSSGYYGMNPSPLVRLRVNLAYPESPGRRLSTFRGSIPVIVASRKSDPLAGNLTSPASTILQNRDVAMTIREVRLARGKEPAVIDLTIRTAPEADFRDGHDAPSFRPESLQQQLEILDAGGKILPWFPTGLFFNGDETRLSLTLLSRGSPAVPASIRYHAIRRAPTEIPFEFRDVPIP